MKRKLETVTPRSVKTRVALNLPYLPGDILEEIISHGSRPEQKSLIGVSTATARSIRPLSRCDKVDEEGCDHVYTVERLQRSDPPAKVSSPYVKQSVWIGNGQNLCFWQCLLNNLPVGVRTFIYPRELIPHGVGREDIEANADDYTIDSDISENNLTVLGYYYDGDGYWTRTVYGDKEERLGHSSFVKMVKERSIVEPIELQITYSEWEEGVELDETELLFDDPKKERFWENLELAGKLTHKTTDNRFFKVKSLPIGSTTE